MTIPDEATSQPSVAVVLQEMTRVLEDQFERVNQNLEWIAFLLDPRPYSAILTLQGGVMPGQITVDTTNATATVSFVDDKGDTNAPAPAGAVVTFTSDNPAVATIATSAGDALVGDITPVAEGSANIGATIADASGNPILEPDGVTPFSVSAAAVTVVAGAAVGAELTLQNTQ